VARCQCDQLLALRDEEWIRGDDEPIAPCSRIRSKARSISAAVPALTVRSCRPTARYSVPP
jgi:hypothetical protein